MSKFPPLSCDLTVPFVIDLDGTLVPTDTLHEALFLLFRRDWSQDLAGSAVDITMTRCS
jgi:hypothetical protein